MHGPGSRDAGRRGLLALATAVAALVALTVMAGVSWSATGTSSASQYQYGTKVTICHHTHSKKHPMHTINVSVNAWKAHQKHGDTMGACQTAPTSSTTPSHGQSGSQHGKSGESHGKGHGK